MIRNCRYAVGAALALWAALAACGLSSSGASPALIGQESAQIVTAAATGEVPTPASEPISSASAGVPPTAAYTPTPLPTGFVPPPPAAILPTSTPVPLLGPAPADAVQVVQPQIGFFMVDPSERLAAGQTVTVSWSVENAVWGSVGYEIITDPSQPSVGGDGIFLDAPAGSRPFTIQMPPGGNVLYLIFSLNAINGIYDPITQTLNEPILEAYYLINVPVVCANPWFMTPAPRWCSQFPADSQNALAQRFEHGMMIWRESGIPGPPPTVFVLHGDGLREQFVYAPTPGEQIDPSLTPPPGMLIPDQRLYGLWYTGAYRAPAVRDTLGWATAPPVEYRAQLQTESAPGDQPHQQFLSGPTGAVYLLTENGSFYNAPIWSIWK